MRSPAMNILSGPRMGRLPGILRRAGIASEPEGPAGEAILLPPVSGGLGGRPARILLVALLILFAAVLLRTAWVSDDAYITLRTVDNLVHGYGPRWNVAERVQSFTDPLWMLGVSAVYFFTREAFYTVTLLSCLASLATAAILAWRFRASPFSAAVGITALVLSRAFVDYSTSGLENPLTHLLLALFFILLLQDRSDAAGLFLLSLYAGLITLNRMDALLLVAPALGWRLARFRRWRGLMVAAAGFLPFLAWELFSLVYYGIPYPNTALAKLRTGIPLGELTAQGLAYFGNSLRNDPLTLAAIGAALLFAALRRRPDPAAVAAGILLYLAYVVRVGGDFMSGRFFTAPFLLATLLLVSGDYEGRRALRAAGLLAVLFLGLAAPLPTLLSGRDYGLRVSGAVDGNGIADERRFYFGTSGLFNAAEGWTRPVPSATRHARQLRRTGSPLTLHGATGLLGFVAGPTVHIVDYHALGDPLLSRLPMVKEDPLYEAFLFNFTHRKPERGWRSGHFLRNLPAGYFRTVVTGSNRIQDPRIAELYGKLLPILRGPLFDASRLLSIARLNAGRYDGIVPRERPAYREPDWNELVSALPEEPEAHYQRAQFLADTKRCGDALRDLQRTLALDPLHVEALILTAQCHEELGDYDQAVRFARQAISVQPEDQEPWATLAYLLRLQGRRSEALDALRKVLALDRAGSPATLFDMGNVAIEMQDFERAEGWLRESLELDPGNPLVASQLGSCLLVRGKTDSAKVLFERALRLNPACEPAAVHLAELWLGAGEASRAEKWLDRFLWEFPNSGRAHLLQAEILERRGDRPRAIKHYRAAALLGLEPARQALARLEAGG